VSELLTTCPWGGGKGEERMGEGEDGGLLFPKLRMEAHRSLTRAGITDFCSSSQMGQETA